LPARTRARQLSLAGVALVVSFTATVALAQVSKSPDRAAAAKARSHRLAQAKPLPHAPRGYGGPRGFAGIAGTAGQGGDPGPTGPAGPAGVVDQVLAIDWQNGNYSGHDSATFIAPGIGEGIVGCSLDTQWVNFIPYDPNSDSEMWAAIMRGNEVSVRAAARRSPFFGNEFNLGLNTVNGSEAEGQGSMVGIISSRGAFASAGGAGPAPTTFHLSWHWSFADAYGPRCYVAGKFETGR
jgi:hypothetical protein